MKAIIKNPLKNGFISKKYVRKIFTVLVVFLVLEIAIFGYLSLGKAHAEKSARAECDISSAMLQDLLNQDSAGETKIHQDELAKANIEAFQAGKNLNISLEPTRIFRRLYSLAATVDVSVNTITSSAAVLQEINNYPFNILPLNLKLQGTIDNINEFIRVISGEYPTATIDFVFVDPGNDGSSGVVFADMGINIYSFGGSVNE